MKTIINITVKLVKWYLKATLWFWAAVGVSLVAREAANVKSAGYKPSVHDLDQWVIDTTLENYKVYAKSCVK